MEKISIELTLQDADSLLFLADSLNFYDIGSALSHNEAFDEKQDAKQIAAVECALGHICMSIMEALSNTPETET